MKVRTCYVSNSSSCSFCIVGVEYKREDFQEDADNFELFDNIESFFKNAEDWEYDFDAAHYIESFAYPLEARYDQEDYMKFIGIPVEKMEEWETRKDFFERVVKELKNIGYKGEQKVCFIHGSYRC